MVVSVAYNNNTYNTTITLPIVIHFSVIYSIRSCQLFTKCKTSPVASKTAIQQTSQFAAIGCLLQSLRISRFWGQTIAAFFITMEHCKLSRTGKSLRMIGPQPHPLETSKGYVALHRYILFESLNQPDTTPCHWCHYSLPWKVKKPNAMRFVVCTDFLDSNHSNRDPSNLVPSCFWCSSNRQWAAKYPEFWNGWLDRMKDTPPHQRPNLEEVVKRSILLGNWDTVCMNSDN